ncbi:MucR family transcriptional regulator [Methylobacterium fujisawaense]
MSSSTSNSTDLVVTAARIVGAYVSNNSLPVAELPGLLGAVHATLAGIGTGAAAVVDAAAAPSDKPSPAAIRKSVTPDHLVSFVDGKRYKTLKRHLTANGLDPRSYRERFGLPADYPMVAPSYAQRRSDLAKSIGLGQPGAMAKRDPAPADRKSTARLAA